MRIWYYTVGIRLRSILVDRQIQLATANVSENERPVVWCTLNPRWEPTANKRIIKEDGQIALLGKRETTAHGEGLYRIEVMPEAAPYDWNGFKHHSGISERYAKGLARVAREGGSSWRDWRVSFEPISQDRWLRIEIETKSDHWVELSLETANLWTRPIFEKGCLFCAGGKEARSPWPYMPDLDTGEPHAGCATCYDTFPSQPPNL